ncbi:glutamate--tRNA ligase [Rhizopus microsporus ATCC 52813]|uniref:Glutamate--tRNA ligase, mitochondrial n=1 Tax=Rhizopus microsporus ATCC 52813 TaxID=1340429 RepID=A0A2G4SKC9_RHIZD|nr:glutamate--tRNA ligase [Rhizopus microsporus ATCC 52813]PHZ09221.1 glutamate--tRNA ligase [Rhizopus microsporus ATCC 52813]
MNRLKLAYRPIVFVVTARRYISTPARVRFAPSPTGQLHLGGLRTALYNYLLAKKTNGQFILRIEDTDQSRYVEGAVENLIRALDWAGIHHDEGPDKNGPHAPYYQSERTELYRRYAKQLVDTDHAYRCFCTPERLQKVREARQKQGNYIAYDKHCSYLSEEEIQTNLEKKIPFTIRLRTPYEGMTEHEDLVYGKISFSNKTIDDTILIKSDGYPTYHLANVVDDHLMEITHVLRGEEWLSSTPKHLLLYKALGWKPPLFAHLPLLLNPDGSKLSKRSGDVYVEQYISKGYLPEAINNFVSLLGWHPGHDDTTNDALFTMKELIDRFDIKDINHSGAIVDHQKLDWINKHHLLKRAETKEGLNSLVDMLKPLIDNRYSNSLKEINKEYRLEPNYLSKVIATIKDRIRNIHDIPDLCSYYFIEPNYESKDAVTLRNKLKQPAIDLVATKEFKEQLDLLPLFDAEHIKKHVYESADRNKLNPNHVMMALRYFLTGSRVGAGVAETMEVLGKDTVMQRLGIHK